MSKDNGKKIVIVSDWNNAASTTYTLNLPAAYTPAGFTATNAETLQPLTITTGSTINFTLSQHDFIVIEIDPSGGGGGGSSLLSNGGDGNGNGQSQQFQLIMPTPGQGEDDCASECPDKTFIDDYDGIDLTDNPYGNEEDTNGGGDGPEPTPAPTPTLQAVPVPAKGDAGSG